MRTRTRAVLWLTIPLLVIGLDLASKSLADHRLRLYEQLPLFGQWLVVSRVHNCGLMMGYYSNVPPGYVEWYVRTVPSLILAALVGCVLLRARAAGRWENAGYALLLAGCSANLISEYRSTCVTDILSLLLPTYHYLTFNVADLAIVGGLACIFLGALNLRRRAASECK